MLTSKKTRNCFSIDDLSLLEIETLFQHTQQLEHSPKIAQTAPKNGYFVDFQPESSQFKPQLDCKRLDTCQLSLGQISAIIHQAQPPFCLLNPPQRETLVFLAHQLGRQIALIDCDFVKALATLYRLKQRYADLVPLKIALIGDILHANYAFHLIQLINLVGVSELRMLGPKTLLPKALEHYGRRFFDLKHGLQGIDIIIEIQLSKAALATQQRTNEQDYYLAFGLDSVSSFSLNDAMSVSAFLLHTIISQGE